MYAKDSLETDYLPIFMRAISLVIKLKDGTLNQAIAMQLHDLENDLSEWTSVITEGLNAFA